MASYNNKSTPGTAGYTANTSVTGTTQATENTGERVARGVKGVFAQGHVSDFPSLDLIAVTTALTGS